MSKPPSSDPGRDPIEDQETLDRPPSSPAPRSAARGRGPALSGGQAFGPYRLVKMLGRGAFGQVWEAESGENGRRIALKVLAAEDASPEMLQRFDREGRLAASLNHPHCVYVLSAERIDGSPTIAMELMPGGTLQDVLRQGGPLPTALAVDYALDILEGLEAAHAAGILHRDLKPSNCFLDEHGRAKIGDFGLSKTFDLDSQLTTEGSFLGTPAYASPEQVRGSGVDARSDLYSLGATLYALLCGKPPFEGRELGGVLSRILTEEPRPVGAQGVEVPKGLQAVVMRLLQKDPAKRFRDHAAVRAALVPFSSRGLTVVELPRRFLAFVIDLGLLALLDLPVAVVFFASRSSSLGMALGMSLALKVLYFFGCEALWGRTPGKALLGLRVTGAGTPAATPLQILARTAIFLGLYEVDGIISLAQQSLDQASLPLAWHIAFGVIAAVNTFLPLVSMRARNGYAGLHELGSRTRVRVVRGREAMRVPAARPPGPRPAGAPLRAFGPFEEVAPVWERGGEALLLARDTALRRPVWIHRFVEAARARPLAELAMHAPGRLRWLQGVRDAGGGWDAYEAPAGISLVEWVGRAGPLRWREAREVLLGLARASFGDRPLALDRVWVDAAPGHARIAAFPVMVPAPPGAERALPAERAPAFLHQAALFALEGRVVPEAELRPGVPRAAFPEHARPLLARLSGEAPPPESPEALVQELEQLRRRPAEVTRRQRFFTLLVPAGVPVLVLAAGLLVRLVMGLVPGWVEFFETQTRITALEKLEGQTGPEAEAKREAIRMLLAAGYHETRTSRGMADTLRFMPEGSRRLLEDAARRYPSPTPAQLEEARRRAKLPDVQVRAGAGIQFSVDREGDRSGDATPAEVGEGLMTAWMGIACAALVLSPFFGSGVLLYLSGITIQREDGRRAEAWRRALRAALAWAPLLLYVPRTGTPLGPPDFVLFGVAAVGTVYAVLRPQRGLADVLARTRLVPR